MSIVLARIDNRLLHGIVASQWSHITKADRLMVIDDKVASDPILKESMKIARPAGMSVSIITLAQAVHNFKINKYGEQKIFVVTKSPATILEVLKAGEPIVKLNVGGTIDYKDGVKLSNRAMATADDVSIYKEIAHYGTTITVQYVPADKEIQLFNIIKM